MALKDLLVSLTDSAAALNADMAGGTVTITARLGNQGRVSLGDSATQSTELNPGDSVDGIGLKNLNELYAKSSVASGDQLALLIIS